jgi:DUF1365 family protein
MSTHSPTPDTASALIGLGQVWHRRLRPAGHQFRHDSYFLLLPMRQGRAHGWAVPRRRFGLITFLDQDHGDGGPDALAWFESLLGQEGIEDADGEIWLQTYPRVLGHAFKPVSFWFAHRADGSLSAIVAEVNNTFGERHCYLLQGAALQWGRELIADKVFHVSPFCSVAGQYHFRFERSAEHALARIDLHDEHGPLLETSIAGHLLPFTAKRAHQAFWRMPFMTLGVIARIHWHALRLLLKRVPFFHKPAAPDRFVTR